MAQDGSQPWEGKSSAFPYLSMHHPKDPQQTASYAQQRVQGAPAVVVQSAPKAAGNTGTWDGPAPRGMRTAAAAARSGSGGEASTSQPSSLSLPGGGQMPLVGFGTYTVPSADVIRTALDAGYRHFDCASKYGNEAVVGEGLRQFLAENGRERLFITSKVWNDAHRPAELRRSCEQSIKDLGCSHLDLYLVHWPDAWRPGTEGEADSEVTLQQTWEAMEGLVRDGLVRHIGVSNYSLKQVEATLGHASIAPVVNQVELHPRHAQRKLVGTCMRKGVHCVAYSPLGHGKAGVLELPQVQAIAREIGRPPAQVVLRWNVQRGVPVIPRSVTEKNIRANIDGLFDWALTPEQKAVLDALDAGQRTVDPEWHDWGDDAREGGATKPTQVLG